MTHFSAALRLGDLPSGAWAYGQGAGSESSGVRGEHDRLGRAGGRRGLGCFGGEVSGCHSKPSVFDIWAMPEDGPPIFQPPSGGR